MSKPLVAIVGRPNVGKSTLFNRIIGKRSALVHNMPGVTRDRNYADADWDGVDFRLVDTGGLEFNTKFHLSEKMARQALLGVEEADCVILMLDGSSGITALDREWIQRVRKIEKPKLFVVNKIDSAEKESNVADFYGLGVDPLIPVSSETGRGVGELLDEVVRLVVSRQSLVDGKKETTDQRPPPLNHRRASVTSDSINIAIIGRPNVGKSTLLNRLLGEERSIVDEIPGTTRDPVNSYLNYKDHTLCLVDTAGIRKRGKVDKAVEKFSIGKSLKVMDQSDCTLLLLDGIEGVTSQDAHVAGEAFERRLNLIILVNKWDEGVKKTSVKEYRAGIERRFHFVPYSPLIFVSAKTGKGTEKIFPTVLRLWEQYTKRVETSRINREFKRIVEKHPLPMHRGRNLKIFYATQVDIKPPTFIVFTNEPSKVHFSYERYLNNEIKKAFGFSDVPIRIVFRKRK